MIHRSGLFDSLSKNTGGGTGIRGQVERPEVEVSQSKSLIFPPSLDINLARPFASLARRKTGDGLCDAPTMAGECFGLCGPGCITPGTLAHRNAMGMTIASARTVTAHV